MKEEISPWESSNVKDYKKISKKFGIKPVPDNPELKENLYFRRNLIFGHRDFDKFLKDWKNNKKTSVLTGIMPSGPMHLGHKMTVDQCVWYQDKGLDTYVLIADIEASLTRGLSLKKSRKNAIQEYLANWMALGLDLDKTEVYAQSNRSVPYYRLASLLSKDTTLAEMNAIYGNLEPEKITSTLTQASDVLHLQLDDYKGNHRVLVPVGVDQDPHLRFIRDLAPKKDLMKPASTVHKLIPGLTGGKMSSSKKTSYIGLNDKPKDAEKKIDNAVTGGRVSLDEQKKKGGKPEECMVFTLFKYYFEENDEELEKRKKKCLNGDLFCGECKQCLKERVSKFMKELKEKREEALNEIDVEKIFEEENR